jgi:hypothetical protein
MEFTEAVARADDFQGEADVYLSMQRFWGRRGGNRVTQLTSVYVDLDFHKTDRWKDASPEAVTWAVLDRLRDAGKPEPCLVIFSGRGLQLVWLHDPIPPAARRRWSALERSLVHFLRDFGADPSATDAARVLRLCGTRNSKSGAMVRPLFVSAQSHAGQQREFDELCREFLPAPRPGATGNPRRSRSRRHTVNGPCGESNYTTRSYHQTLRMDLERLLHHRWGGTLRPGQRDSWLFCMAVAQSHLLPPAGLRSEMEQLAWQTAGWSRSECDQRMSAVFGRAEAAAAGEIQKLPNGRPCDPRYRLSPAKIVEMLSITDSEMDQAGLRVLVSAPVARQRATKRQAASRRRRGQMLRTEYRKRAADRSEAAHQLRERGYSWLEIAKSLGFSSADTARHSACRGRVQSGPDKSVTVYGGVALTDGPPELHSVEGPANESALDPVLASSTSRDSFAHGRFSQPLIKQSAQTLLIETTGIQVRNVEGAGSCQASRELVAVHASTSKMALRLTELPALGAVCCGANDLTYEIGRSAGKLGHAGGIWSEHAFRRSCWRDRSNSAFAHLYGSRSDAGFVLPGGHLPIASICVIWSGWRHVWPLPWGPEFRAGGRSSRIAQLAQCPLVEIVQFAQVGAGDYHGRRLDGSNLPVSTQPKNIRLPLMVSRAEAEAIDQWWHRNGLRSRAEAVRSLIQMALQASGETAPAQPAASRSGTRYSPNPEHPYPKNEMSSIGSGVTKQLNVEISGRLRHNVTWMAREFGENDRIFVTRVLQEYIEIELRKHNIDPVF